MALVLIETLDDQAQASLAENPHIRVVGEVNEHVTLPRRKSTRSLAGSISAETAERMHRETEEMRNEWDRGF